MGSKLAREGSACAGPALAVTTGLEAGVLSVADGVLTTAARGAELRLLPINKESAGTRPLVRSVSSSSKRLRYFSLTQSRTKRFGA